MDAGAWIALAQRRDRAHARVTAHYHSLRSAGDALITCNLALAETATRLRYDAGVKAAGSFREIIEQAVATRRLAVRYADAELDAAAWRIMERYGDVALSFADCAGAVTASEAGAEGVFGLDRDFAALGFALEP